MNLIPLDQREKAAERLIQTASQLAEAALRPLTPATTQQIARLAEEVLTLAKRAT